MGTAHAFGDTDAQPTGANPSKLQMAHAFVDQPDKLRGEEGSVRPRGDLTLKPRESIKVRVAMAHGRKRQVPSSRPRLSRLPATGFNTFSVNGAAFKVSGPSDGRDMFTPGNDHFSGHLPTLTSSDAQLSDIYYRSLLTLLVLHRTNMKMCDRVFVTSGERQKGVVFFWDTSMWSKVFALLEPRG